MTRDQFLPTSGYFDKAKYRKGLNSGDWMEQTGTSTGGYSTFTTTSTAPATAYTLTSAMSMK